MGTLWAAGQRLTASMMNQYYSHSDGTDTSVTTTGQTQLTTTYTIPANEPSTDSSYTIKFGGTGTQSGTQQQLQFTVTIQGVTAFNNVALAAAAFAASAQFRFEGEARIVCTATGASGGFRGGIHINMVETANPANPGTASTNAIALSDADAAAVTVDTTSNMIVLVKCGWTGIVGGPTITNRHTIFSKVS